MSHYGRSFTVLSNKFFSVTWVRDHFVWSTNTKKAEFRLTPDGKFSDARFVKVLFEKYWNDGRITDDEYKSLERFREDVKNGKYGPLRESTRISTAHTPFAPSPRFNPIDFGTFIHDEVISHDTLERACAILQGTGFSWRSPADRARNP